MARLHSEHGQPYQLVLSGELNDGEIHRRIVELHKAGESLKSISKKIGISVSAIRRRIKKYNLDVKFEEKNDWKYIIEHVKEIDLPFYQSNGLYPLELRQMYYRLVTLGLLKKGIGTYKTFCSVTAEARKGVSSDYKRKSIYVKLPIDCFIDKHKHDPIGETDIDDAPSDPTPTRPPEDPIELAKGAIEYLKNTIMGYDGKCTPGEWGIKPGKWYKQPYLVELWVEAADFQKSLRMLSGDNQVQVIAPGGVGSTPDLYKHAMRLRAILNRHKDHLKKIIILYFGDLDSTGDWIDEYLVNTLEFYGLKLHKDFEFIRVAVTPEQVEEYDLVEDPEHNSEVNKDTRSNRFGEKYPELVERYGPKFGIQVEAIMTTQDLVDAFKEVIDEEINEWWDKDIYLENCPDEEYDYEANGEEEPEDIDPDNEYADDGTELTMREKMAKMVTDAFRPGWEEEE